MKLDQEYRTEDMPESRFEPIPGGNYRATITAAELKETKARTGMYLNLSFTVDGPEYQGRIVFAMVNLRNPSEKCEAIGRQQLGEILRATGMVSLKDSDELIGKSMVIKVVIRKDEQYGDKNEIKGFKALEGSVPPPPVVKKSANGGKQMSHPATKKAAPPWARHDDDPGPTAE